MPLNKTLFIILKAFSLYWAQKRKLELWLGLVPPPAREMGGGGVAVVRLDAVDGELEMG